MIEIVPSLVVSNTHEKLPHREVRDDGPLEALGKEMDEWCPQVLFDRKPPVGSLDPIAFPNTADFAGEFDLACFISDVLDDGVAKDEVE